LSAQLREELRTSRDGHLGLTIYTEQLCGFRNLINGSGFISETHDAVNPLILRIRNFLWKGFLYTAAGRDSLESNN